jgi:hypothetical protein
MTIERTSLSAAAAVIAAARRSAADHAAARRANRVTKPQYAGELDHRIRTAESSARAARITEQLAELAEDRRHGRRMPAGLDQHGRHETRPAPQQAEPMGYEAGDRVALANGQTFSAADVCRSQEVREASEALRASQRRKDAAAWAAAFVIGTAIAVGLAALPVLLR